MSPDQLSGLSSLALLLVLAFVMVGAGYGFLLSAGRSKDSEKGGGGMNAGRVVAVVVVGLVLVIWLSAPGTGQGIAAVINAMWANLVVAVQPIVAIATQLAVLFAAGYIIYLVIRSRRRR